MAPKEEELNELPLEDVPVNIQQIMSKLEQKQADKAKKEEAEGLDSMKESKKKRAVVDQTEMMFTNPNVGVKHRKKP